MRYQLVGCMGDIYRLTSKQFKNFLEAHSQGGSPSLWDFGVLLGTTINITDVTPEGAKEILETLKGSAKKEGKHARRRADD